MAIVPTYKKFVDFGFNTQTVDSPGLTSEELKSKTRPDKNPMLGPLADMRVIDNISPNPNKASDRYRIEEPAVRTPGGEDQTRLTLFYVRSALDRLRKNRMRELMKKSLKARREKYGDRAPQMEASLARVDTMADTLSRYAQMAESVLGRVLSQQKG